MKYYPLLAWALLSSTSSFAANIPGLFNTGVDDEGILLDPGGTVDPHYTLIESPDEMSPGPEAVTLNPGFPVGPWLAEGPDSRWIAPRAEQNVGSAEGDFTYRTTFDLTGFDPSTATITGRWSTDNGGVDILLNGESLFLTSTGFDVWTDFEITSGFVAGENTLDFVLNNAEDANTSNNPTGLRVELQGTADLLADSPPVVSIHPQSKRGIVGEELRLNVTATGMEPLDYEWRRGEEVIGDAAGPTLILPSVSEDDAGDYVVTVSNAAGSATSNVAVVDIFPAIPGLFNTGVDDVGNPVDDLAVDPHYVLAVNPDGGSMDAVVHDSAVFPIVEGPWLANSEASQWIAPRGDTAAAPTGRYTYRLTFDLTDLDPSTAFILGSWATDDGGFDTLLNGASLGIGNGGGFGGLSNFTIEGAPFVSGVNTLDFVIDNGAIGPTGLRIENLRGGARADAGGPAVPFILVQPESAVALVGERVTLNALADGTPPLSYTWERDGEAVGTGPELVLESVQPDQEGDYLVVVSNEQGSTESEVATVTVLEPIPGLFSTGVDDDGTALDDLGNDPHYMLIAHPNEESPDVIVLDSMLFPIVAGPWLPNEADSKWIGVQENNEGPAGDYTYRISFDLSAFNPENVFVEGAWATDNVGLDILLNGESTGVENAGQFTALTPFRFEEGFVAGVNTLDFVINNAGDADNPTGLKVVGLRGGGATEDPNLIAPTGTPFGQQETSEPTTATLTLRNSGRTQPLVITGASLVGENAAAFTLGEVPMEIAPNASITIELGFDPAGATGNFAAAVELTTNDPSTPTFTVDISAFIPVAPHLLAHYRMNEKEGNQMIDASGFGRTGAYEGAGGQVALGQEPLAGGTSVQFMEGGMAVVPAGLLPALEGFTISLWAQVAEGEGAVSLISRGNGEGDPFALLVSGTSLLWFAGGQQVLTVENAFTLNEPQHVVATSEGIGVTLYVNGVEAGSEESSPFVDSADNGLQLGAANGILGINGRLDDIQIYSRTVSSEEAQFLFSNPGDVLATASPMPPAGDSPLEIALVDGSVRLAWPSELTDDALFSSIDLIDWTPVETAPTLDGEDFVLELESEGERYFRLQQP